MGVSNEQDSTTQSRRTALLSAATDLSQIATNFETWAEEQRAKFTHPNGVTPTDCEKWISDWLSDFYILTFFDRPDGRGQPRKPFTLLVDIQDLIVLSEHLFEAVDDPTLVAHWALDETEGITARDSVSGSDDLVMGGALWQPAGGKADGALELDGVDDCIITSFGAESEGINSRHIVRRLVDELVKEG